MNSDEIKNAASIGVGIICAGLVGAGYMTADQSKALLTDLPILLPALGTVGAVIASVYSHWNMKKVPETATVMPPK